MLTNSYSIVTNSNYEGFILLYSNYFKYYLNHHFFIKIINISKHIVGPDLLYPFLHIISSVIPGECQDKLWSSCIGERDCGKKFRLIY